MLRFIGDIEEFRCINGELFRASPGQVVLGKHTHIFGRNGSGKSTFSELLRLVGTGAGPSKAKWHGLSNSEVVGKSKQPSGIELRIFNRWYIEENLASFADGSGDSAALFKVGKESVENKQERDRVNERLVDSRARWLSLRNQTSQADKDLDALLDRARASVTTNLLGADPTKYNQTRYNKAVVRKKFNGGPLVAITDTSVLSSTLATATSSDVQRLQSPRLLEADVARFRAQARALLALRIETEVIAEFGEDPVLARWVEHGLELHTGLQVCKFCGSRLPSELLPRLARHFNDSLSQLRNDLHGLSQEILNTQSALKQALAEVPRHDEMHASVRERWVDASETLASRSASAMRDLDELSRLVALRVADPLNEGVPVPFGPDLIVSNAECIEIISSHDDVQQKQSSLRATAASVYEDHLLSGLATEFKELTLAANRKIVLGAKVEAVEKDLRVRLRDLELESKDSSLVAGELNRDLAVHFGHSHLNIILNPGGDGYTIMRDSQPAVNLSEGERNAITLSYFLRSLDAPDVDPSRTLVAIDDPVTSMDRDAMFATHSLLRATLDRFAQSIVLTHDYEYLRLCINSMNSQWGKSQARIRDGEAKEKSFPRVQFLEISAGLRADGSRESKISLLPANLVRHPSEYHYLFARVQQASVVPADHDLPLLANAARRLLEGFLAFKAPNVGTTQGKLDAVAAASNCEPELAARVLRFANALSHRDEPNIQTSLEFVSANNELSAVLRFIKACDKSHYDAMVKSTA